MPVILPSVSNRERTAPSTEVERCIGVWANRSVMKAAFTRGVWNELRMSMKATLALQAFRATFVSAFA